MRAIVLTPSIPLRNPHNTRLYNPCEVFTPHRVSGLGSKLPEGGYIQDYMGCTVIPIPSNSEVRSLEGPLQDKEMGTPVGADPA